jgi:hypothetical protein
MPRIRRVVNETGPTNIFRHMGTGRITQHAFHITDGGLTRDFFNHILNKPDSFFKKSWMRNMMRPGVKISIAARFEYQGWRSGGKFKSILDNWDVYDANLWGYDYNIEQLGNITDFKIYVYEAEE